MYRYVILLKRYLRYYNAPASEAARQEELGNTNGSMRAASNGCRRANFSLHPEGCGYKEGSGGYFAWDCFKKT